MLSKNNCLAVILPSLKIGGGNRVLLKFFEEMCNEKLECKLFFLDRVGAKFTNKLTYLYPQKIIGDGIISILFFSIMMSFKIRFDKRITTVLISDPILILFSFIYTNKKIIRFVQSNDFELFDENVKAGASFNFIYKKLFKLSQKYNICNVFFNSKYSLDSYNKTLPTFKYFTKTNIVSPSVFTLNYDRNSNYFPSNKLTRICIITSHHPRKGFTFFQEIVRNSKLKNIKYTVISQDNLFTKLSNIKIIKPKDDKGYVDELKKNHFILSTSTFEGFGLPLAEGMALGIVPIALYNEGMNEYNNNSITLFNDVNDFDTKLSNIINNKNIYKDLSNKALKSSSKFTEKTFYNLLMEKIYQSI